MNTELLNNPAERRKQVKFCVRPDLQTSEQRYEGKVFHVVKDPVCLRYYRFNRQEYHVFQLFDGKHTLEEVRKAFEDEFRPHRLEFHDLEAFARQLVMAGLVQAEHAGAGKHLFERRAKQRRTKRIAAVTNILYWKIPVFDPDRILTWMYGYLWWIFTAPFFVLSTMFMLAAVLLVTVKFQTFYDKMPAYHEFFAFRTVLYMWISLGVVKVIHEFGHGLSCKAFKGECHEMGILLMCLSPALYCNVTDAWTLADKWKRIIISFAGIYVELCIAAASTFVWWYTPHLPFINNIALCLMVLCSVSTVMFNANPLMRFDGYYMMADWLEVPNLRDRSNKFITNLFQEHCLGIEVQPEPYMALGRKILFVTYAVAAYIYRWVVMFGILWVMADMLGPQLKVISQMIAVASVTSMFVWPTYRMVKNFRQRGRLPDMKPKRVYATTAAGVALLAAFFLVPLPISRVWDTGLVAVDPDHAKAVGLADPGHLVALKVTEGQPVADRQLLAVFDSRELREQQAQVASRWKEQVSVADALAEGAARAPAKDREQLELQARSARTQALLYEQEKRLIDARLAGMSQLVAPTAGVVMSLPHPDEVGKLFDKYSSQGRPVCIVGDPTKLVVKVPVVPLDYRLLREDLPPGGSLDVTVCVSGRTHRLYNGKLRKLPESDAKQVPFALTQRGGGPLAVKQSGDGGQDMQPVAQVYIIQVELTDPDVTVRPGALVQVKVHCQWRSAAWWVGRKLSEALDIGLY